MKSDFEDLAEAVQGLINYMKVLYEKLRGELRSMHSDVKLLAERIERLEKTLKNFKALLGEEDSQRG